MWFILILIFIFIFLTFFLNIYFYFKKQNYIKQIYINTNFDETKKLNEVKIIGTHNSLSYKIKNILSPFAKTQTYDLDTQLKKGIRYFDLRFKPENDVLEGYHGFVKLNINHETIFNTFIEFLNKNQNQFIIIVLKNENFNNHEEIPKVLYKYIQEKNLENYFHFNIDNWSYIPDLKTIQKKIYLLNFLKKDNYFINLPWSDNNTFTNNAITISDCYKKINNDKIITYKNFKKNYNKNNINVFYFSSEYNFIFGLYYYNKFFKKQLEYNINKDDFKNSCIYVFDFFELYFSIYT